MSHPIVIVAAAAIALFLGACQEVRVPGVYRIDIQQGNVITQDQLAALERGMDKRKVRFILGTPLVADTFNQDRWDYYYSIEKRGEDRMQRIISVFFRDERLDRVSGDVLAALGPIEVNERKDEVVPVPEGYRDLGLLASLTPAFLGDRKPRKEESAEAAAAQPATDAETRPVEAMAINEDDERFLRDTLVGFGRGVVTAAEPAQAGSGAAAQQQRDEEAEQESIFSRWARRLGIEGNEPTGSPVPPTE